MLRTLFVLYGRNIRQMPRIPTVLVFGIAMPIVQLMLFGTVFSATTDLPGHPYQGEPYYMFIAPAVVLLTAFLGMANSSAAFIVDLRTGYFDKLRTTPAEAWMTITARLGAEMTRVSGQALLILLIALGLGARVETGVLGAVALIVTSVLFSALTSGLLVMALAMKTRSDQATQSTFPLFFILLFLSTAFMPEPLLPGWLQDVAAWNPINSMILGMRALMFDTWSEALPDLMVGIAAAAGVAVLLGFLNARIFKRLIG